MMIDDEQVAKAWHLVSTEDPSEVVRWAARRGDRMEGSWARSPLELVQFAHAYRDWDFYVQPNPTKKRHGVRCSTEDITRWRWFLIDADPVGDARPTQARICEVADWLHDAMNAYVGVRVRGTPVYSGRGLQVWVPLVPTNLGGAMFLTIPACQRYWLSRLQSRNPFPDVVIDVSASADLPRLFRCPGTVNRKTGDLAVMGSVHPPNEGLAGKILAWTPDAEKQLPRPTVMDGLPTRHANWQTAVGYMTFEGANFVTFGATEPGRHRACCAAARSLAECGVEEDEIVRALATGGQRCRPEILDEAYFRRTARDAVRRVGSRA